MLPYNKHLFVMIIFGVILSNLYNTSYRTTSQSRIFIEFRSKSAETIE